MFALSATSKIIQRLQYYLQASYQRKLLDQALARHIKYYRGTVLDIGGRRRGRFDPQQTLAHKWVTADLETKRNPDIILDVCNMNDVRDKSIDTINALYLFEHVLDPEKGLQECFRILKSDGVLIAAAPFMVRIHADPSDYQRWTQTKWEKVLHTVGFRKINCQRIGSFFTVTADIYKECARNLFPPPFKQLLYLTFPLCDLWASFDRFKFTPSSILNSFVAGYFIVAEK